MEWIDSVLREVAELPDRNSPDGWPEAMLVTGAELRQIIVAHAPAEAEAQQSGPVRLTEAEIQIVWIDHGLDECDVEGFARAIESAVLERNGLNPQAKPAYGPNNPARLRRPHESVAAYREAMGWPADDQPQAKGAGSAYGPNNPPRLRRPDESVDDYRAAMGWSRAGINNRSNGD